MKNCAGSDNQELTEWTARNLCKFYTANEQMKSLMGTFLTQ